MDIHPKATNPESLCGTCAAFDEANGECRRGHPTETSGDGYGIWPKVSAAIDWCLRWLPAD